MKVSELYKITKDLMYEKTSSTIYDTYLISNLNLVISELYMENNFARVFRNKLPITDVSTLFVTQQSDEITAFEPEFLYKIIPLGLATRFEIDDDLSKRSIYATEYNNARVLEQKIVSVEKFEEYWERALNAD